MRMPPRAGGGVRLSPVYDVGCVSLRGVVRRIAQRVRGLTRARSAGAVGFPLKSPWPYGSALADARHPTNPHAEDDGRGGACVLRDERLDGGQLREEREQEVHRARAIRRAGDLLVSPVSDHALPFEIVFDVVNLKADARVLAHRLDLATGQRVTDGALAVEDVVDGDDVWVAFGEAAEPPHPTPAQERERFVSVKSGNHGSPSRP